MPMRFESTAGGTGYGDIRVGEVQVHQVKLDVSDLYDDTDDDGFLPPGTGISATGTLAHASGTAVAVIGPEPVKIGTAADGDDVFGNAIFAGVLNGDMIADNVGSALAATLPKLIVLV